MAEPVKRLKLRRKDIRQPDEFVTVTSRVATWAREHRSLVAGIALGLVVVALVALLIGRTRAVRNEAAAAAFRSAHRTFEAGSYADAAEAFAALGREYPRTPFGRLAGLYRARALARQGDHAAAATAYGEYLAGSPQAPYLRQQALVGLAEAREASGDAAGALDAYTEAGALEGPLRPDALMAAARLQEAAGQGAEARALYTRLLAEGPGPDLRAVIRAKVPDLGEPSDEPEAGANVR
jgi:tetratricopeptide (TPR) repeat protein